MYEYDGFLRYSFVPANFDLVSHLTEEVIESHLRVVYSDEREYLDLLAEVAIRTVENACNHYLQGGSLVINSHGLPVDVPFPFKGNNMDDITIIQYVDSDGNTQMVTPGSDDYSWSDGNPTMLSWHGDDLDFDLTLRDNCTVMLTVPAPVTDATKIPKNMIQAALLFMGHLYENREAVSTEKVYELPLAFQYLVNQSRVFPSYYR